MVRFRSVLAAVLGVLSAGCSRSPLPDDALPTYPITGALTYEGKPMDGVAIAFVPVAPASKWRTPSSSGRADQDGRYTLNTYLTADGAPAGEYIVTIYWPEPRNGKSPALESPNTPLAPDRLKGIYAVPKTSKLRVTVEPKENIIDFDLP